MAYRAEIEIGVKGVKKLDRFQSQIERLSNEVDRVNKKKFTIGNLSSYNEALRKTNETLNQTEIEIDSAGKAAGLYKKNLDAVVTALITSNRAQEIQSRLLKQELQDRGAATQALKAYNAELAAPTKRGAATTMAGAYLRGAFKKPEFDQPVQSAPLLPAFQERGLQLLDNSVKANESQLRIEAALNGQRARGVRFLEKQSAEERRQLDLKINGIERTNLLPPIDRSLSGELSSISTERTAAGTRAETGFPVALPETRLDREIEQRTKINNIIDDQITFNDQVAKGLERQRKVGLDINAVNKGDNKLTDENLKKLGVKLILKDRELATERKLQEAIKRGEKLQRGRENAIIGGAFPLLFGQSAGAAVGGGLGGFFGGQMGGQMGFGLSLVGTAIGQAFDDANKRVVEMGNAIRSLDLSALEKSAIRVSEELKFQVDKLKEQGNFAKARALVETAIAKQTGSTSQVIKDIANAGNLLNAAFKEVVASGSVLLGSVAAPLSALLAGILKVVAEIFKLINRVIAAIGEVLRSVERIIDPAQNIKKAIESTAPALAENTAEMRRFADEAKRASEIIQNNLDFDLAVARNSPLGSTAEDKIDRKRLEQQAALRDVQADINKQLLEANKLTGKARTDQIRSLFLQKAKRDRLVELNTLRDITLIKIAEERRVQAENLRLARQQAQAVKQRLADAKAVVAAVIEANAIESEFLNQPLPSPKPFSGLTDEQKKNAEIERIQRQAAVDIAQLSNQGLKESLRLEKERTIEGRADLDILRVRVAFADKQRTKEENIIKARIQAAGQLEKEINLINAKINGNEEEVSLSQQVNDIVRSTGIYRLEDIENIEALVSRLNDAKKAEEAFGIAQQARFAGAGLQAGFIGQAGKAFESKRQEGASIEDATKIANLTQQMELAQVQAQALESAVLGIGNAFATAMTTGVSELIAGTKSAEEVFADFLKNIGDALVSAATQMIATYIAIGIAKAFAGMSGGSDLGSDAADPGSGLRITEVAKYMGGKANGGPVSGGQPYMVGERGPELFVPGQSGGVMRNEDMRSLMGRSPASGGAASMNFSFETTSIGGTEYVSREQLESAMAVTRKQASNDGAKRGMSMTLDKMQNSPRTRTRIGLR